MKMDYLFRKNVKNKQKKKNQFIYLRWNSLFAHEKRICMRDLSGIDIKKKKKKMKRICKKKDKEESIIRYFAKVRKKREISKGTKN